MLWIESLEHGPLGAGDTGWLRDVDNLVGVVGIGVLGFDHLLKINAQFLKCNSEMRSCKYGFFSSL
jgi:hypothetical protein